MIRYSEQLIDKKDIESVVKVLKSKFLTTGPVVKKFERHITKNLAFLLGLYHDLYHSADIYILNYISSSASFQ